MGKALRFSLFIVIVPVLAFFPIFSAAVFSQISIYDARTFEVSFTEGETERTSGGIEISVRDLFTESAVPELRGREATRFTSSKEHQEGGFFVDAYNEISVGSYYHQTAENAIADLRFVNRTPDSFDKLSLAFDFVFLPEQLNRRLSYQLSYRINDGEWVYPSGGKFHSDFLQTEERGWSTFSMQISVDQLFLRSGDEIELRWSASGLGSEEIIVPIALQKMEIQPTVAPERDLRAGSLIITELLPLHRYDGSFLEYIEIYNSTESGINLKGLLLDAGYDEIVVQHNLVVPPYRTVVLANSNQPDRIDSFTDYRFNGTLLGSRSGRLDARFGSHEVARVMYDVSASGIAHQLDHLRNAFDGYSSMRYLVPVGRGLNEQVQGSPGDIDASRKLFTKEMNREGWYIINPPGELSESLNRKFENSLTPLKSQGRSDQQTEEGKFQLPAIYYHDSDQPEILYSEGVESGRSASVLSTRFMPELNISSVRAVTGDSLSADRIRTSQGGRAYPALLGWDNRMQKFKLIHTPDELISAWDATFVPSDGENTYQTELVKSDEEASSGLNRYLALEFSGESGSNGSVRFDEALIGFWNTPQEAEGLRMDLPKFWAPVREDDSESRTPMIYLKTPESVHQANSFLNFEYAPEEPVQVAVGIRLGHTNGRYTISWDEIESLPEQWHVQFVDTELDESINMRREHSYTFYERSDRVLMGMRDASLNFTPVEETDYNRFYIRISPSGSPADFEEETDMSDSFELRQNYPNPFNPSTTVVFYLPKTSDVKVSVYNVVGQQVGVLRDERLSAGEHSVVWNAMDMPSGVYIVQMEAGNRVDTRKITLIK
ncbi:T9SS type A sorting domain-containing protein [Rhodohalobacter sp. SW132]|uniref:T9SS type A sorting domain-containing protein n=1 Tax=Rhodohalobacter sp. SW132 TaxID=2293433 RepID=UPI0013149555|nr:T9SS type A sorting domain-containing protein [Rhodohalobacter sp. SW132]